MTQAPAEVRAVRSRPFSSRLKGWLYRYRPRFGDWHFWVVLGLVISIASLHDVIVLGGYLPELGLLYFLPISLFFVPVVYAGLVFGFAGSIATGLWVVVITIPNWVFFHTGPERWGVILQLFILVAVAALVGNRVDREMEARRRAEAALAALRSSEMRYRSLFESSPIAILVLDPNGAILDANPAAGALFGKAAETLKSRAVVDLVGPEGEQRLLTSPEKGKWQEAALALRPRDNSEVYLEPTYTQVSDSQGKVTIQLLLRDVTQERHRQAGLRAYAAYVLRAQEEERQHIARELHDGTIQTLALLCRRLDAVASTSGPLPDSAVADIGAIRKIAEDAVKELRDFARTLRPPILDDLGIVASVRRLLMEAADRSGIKGELKLVGEERRLPPDAEVGIFRIAQEALWNVEHHSRATQVIVTMSFGEHEARLDVDDNGVGFNVPPVLGDAPVGGQLGLLGMQERAELLGGKFEVQSSPGKGTTVTVSIPAQGGISEVTDRAAPRNATKAGGNGNAIKGPQNTGAE